MSRVSRWQKKEEDSHKIPTCIYLRMSYRDPGSTIENQRNILRNYIKTHPQFQLWREYRDEEVSGYSFERSGFQTMMKEIYRGDIKCIIVKDLSRLGRNYLETGHYLEEVFPTLGVQLISVTENLDTWHSDPFTLSYGFPLKNLMNEAYLRDISKKEKSVKDILRAQGKFLGPFAPYGYQKSAEDKHLLEPDPHTAEIVVIMYQMAQAGSGDTEIANYLNTTGILSPSGKENGWRRQTVARILTDPVYQGDLIQGKQWSPAMKEKKEVAPVSHHIVVRGTHKPLISRNEFEYLQAVRRERAWKKNSR